MGEAHRRLERFKADGHLNCAYCGGTRSVESIDHVPPTAFFKNKQRPNSYETPACMVCHRPFSDFDSLFSLFSKMHFSDGNGDSESRHFDNLISSSVRKFPDLVGYLRAAAKQTYVKINGVWQKTAVIRGIPTELIVAICFVTARTTAALYYHNVGKILPVGTQVHTIFMSAEEMRSPGFNDNIIFGLPNYRTLRQGQQEFSNQFEYRYLIGDDEQRFYCAISHKRVFGTWGLIDTEISASVGDKLVFEVTSQGIRPHNDEVLQSWIDRKILPAGA